MSVAAIVLALVTAQRLGELLIARRNTRFLLEQGGREFGRDHYHWLVALHLAWLAALWAAAPGRPFVAILLGLFLLLQLARIWVIASLGRRWTTRIIVLPGAALVRRGPYRLLAHPNYVVVTLEIAVLPLAFGLVWIAIVFSILNAIILAIRIRCENGALARSAPIE